MFEFLFSNLTFFCFVVYLASGIYVLLQNPGSRLNRLFFLICLCFSIWTGTFFLFHFAQQKEALWILYKISGLGWILAPALLLHFFLQLSESDSILKQRWIYSLIYLPPLVMFYKNTTGIFMVQDLVRIKAGWIEIMDPYNPWTLFYILYYVSFLLFGFMNILRWGRRSPHPSKKIQSRIIIRSGIIALILSSTTNIILPSLKINVLPSSLGANFLLIWIISIMYAILRHKLMAFSAAVVADDIFSAMNDALIVFDWSKRILDVNQSAANLIGRSESSLKGQKITDLFPGESIFQNIAPDTLTRESSILNHELDFLHKNGEHHTLSISVSPAYDQYDFSMGGLLLIRDITALKVALEKLKHTATHDALTLLPNRLLLIERLKQALARARRYNHQVAVMLLDLDDFKRINDSFGHDIGDLLLKKVAEVLQKQMRESDTVARLGGDEFIIMATDLQKIEQGRMMASRILKTLETPMRINSHTIKVGASIGISIFPDDSENIEDLLKSADIAMYQAKKEGKSLFRFISETVKDTIPPEASMETALKKALENSEFELHYQPIYDLMSEKITAVEALLRWPRDKEPEISPMTFIPIAKKTDLMHPIGLWVLEKACQQQKIWQNEGQTVFPMAVNLSCCQFIKQNLADVIERLLKKFGLPPDVLQIEITESTVVSDIERSRNILGRLAEMGIKCIIDEFGGGIASFKWLKDIPAHAIKIEKHFVRNMINDPNSTGLVVAIIAMAHGMGLKVIAVGVETKEQLASLRLLERPPLPPLCCDQVQGYLFSAPLSSADFSALMKHRKTNQ